MQSNNGSWLLLTTSVPSLALTEMRVILAKCLFAFDMELDQREKSEHWINKQRQFLFWEKPPLHVKLTPVER